MVQLRMCWRNDGMEAQPVVFPEGVALKRLSELPDGVQTWLEIARYLWREEVPVPGLDFYKQMMTDRPNYREDRCFILTVEGIPAATVTVLCDEETKEGYVHVVASKPEFRGRGLGHLLNAVAVQTLKEDGMQTATLKTDDWRIPAIRTYLKAGFCPDLESEPDYSERWANIRAILENQS